MGSCGLPNEFCFINLKKGVKVIGIITCLLSLIFSIQLLVYLCSDYDAIAEEISDNDPQVKENLRPHKTSVQAVAGVLLGMFILYFASSIFLIKGEKNSTKHLIPFLGITALIIIVSLIFAAINFSQGPFFAVLTLSIILIYFFLCVLSLYYKLSEDN